MEKINTEILISSLLVFGFDVVDPMLFTFVLGQLSIDNRNMKVFEFEDQPTSKIFDQYIDYDGIVFSIKKEFNLDTSICLSGNRIFPLKKLLHTNRKLLEYLQRLDVEKIVLTKLSRMGGYELISKEKYNYLFSSKERKIIEKMCVKKDENIGSEKIKKRRMNYECK